MATQGMRIGLVGYGEVGRILAEDLRRAGHAVRAFDTKLYDQRVDALRAHARAHGVLLAGTPAEAVAGCTLVFSAVTAAQAVAAADSVAPHLAADACLVDLNSASPQAKSSAAARVHRYSGRYVEAAVMASVPPYRLRVPMLLGGPHAAAAAALLAPLGFEARVGNERLGVVSATKLCRSVMIKGLEALVVEAYTAARAHGVEDAVLASLAETFPGLDWEAQGSYLFQRVIEHGRRRGEELSESARMQREIGLAGVMAEATSWTQAQLAELADDGVFGPRDVAGFARSGDWRIEADRLLAARPKLADTSTRSPDVV
jgi:3-hydroxyisobutyrate dehydrogenase-like beta-hydroxyacid dehydrogenase